MPPQIPGPATGNCVTAYPAGSVKREIEAQLGQHTHFMLAFTGAIRGQTEPCECSSAGLGGADRIGEMLRALRSDYPESIRMDAGDLVDAPSTDPAKAESQFLTLMKAMLGGDVNCFGVGEKELAHFASHRWHGRPFRPMILTNVSVAGQAPWTPWLCLERAGGRVLVLCVVSADVSAGGGVEPLAVEDSTSAVAAALRESPEPALIVLISHLDSLAELEDLVRFTIGATPRTALVVVDVRHAPGATDVPKLRFIHGCPVVTPSERGTHIGLMNVWIAPSAEGSTRWQDLATTCGVLEMSHALKSPYRESAQVRGQDLLSRLSEENAISLSVLPVAPVNSD